MDAKPNRGGEPSSEGQPAALAVLVAEDNPVNQEFMALMLRGAGHEVEVVENGALALAAVDRRKFDIVLMDLQMPVMDGLRAAKLIRAREKAVGGRVPIVAVTANVLPGERQRCLTAGMDDYLPKPIRVGDLLAVMGCLVSPSVEDEAGPKWLRSLRGLGFADDAISKLARTFVATVPERLEALAAAAAAGDIEAVRVAAHTLKSSFGVFAATRAEDKANELEALAHQGRNDGAVVAVAELRNEAEGLLRALRGHIGEPKGEGR